MNISLKTFGCRANSTDSDFLAMEILKRGHQLVSDDGPADAFILNTCTVTENADKDARRQASIYKRKNPQATVAMVGCYAQVAAEELSQLPQVDLIVGTANKIKILDYLEHKPAQKNHVETATGFLPETFMGSQLSRAPIKIQDGCNYKCSFCIIPQARGRSRSLPVATVLQQIREAHAQGFREVILTGIHLAHYGWDVGTDLVGLLRAIFQEKEGPRVRISTLDPFELPDEILEMLKVEPRLCPHFHIALQSGSDKILQRMRRLYQAAEFRDATERIFATNPNTFIGVDVIVGFPGETEEDFQITRSLLKATHWSKLHVFSFSARKGTAAADLDQKVAKSDIQKRSKELRALSERRFQKFVREQLKRPHDLILERPSKRHVGKWIARTENYLSVLVSPGRNHLYSSRQESLASPAGAAVSI